MGAILKGSWVSTWLIILILAIGCAGGETGELDVNDSDNSDLRPPPNQSENQDPNQEPNQANQEPNQDPNQEPNQEPNQNPNQDPNQEPNQDPNQEEPDPSCFSNDDCTAPEICVRDTPGAEGVCQDPSDTRGDGQSCSSSAQCQSGLCYEQTCTRECDDEGVCVAGWLCRDYDGDTGYCAAPQTCSSARDCDDLDELCAVERNGAVRVICLPPVGGGALGDSCTTDDQCEAGLCLEGMCSQPCSSPSDCGPSGDYTCTTEDLGGSMVNVCTERPLESCLTDGECTLPGERCVATVEDDDLFFACGDPNAGGGEGGDLCTDDGDCAQNLCIDGACAAPCDDDAICTDIPASSCGTNSVTRGNASGTVNTCSVPVLCDAASECGALEVCYIHRGTSSVDTICRLPNADNRADGESCSSNSQCASNYCREGRFGSYCSSPCATSGDCPAEADGFAMECGTAEISHGAGSETINACVRAEPDACTTNGDCTAAGQACVFVVNEAATGLETLCLPAPGGEPGASCTSNSQCASGYCLASGSCSAPCDDRDQCGEFQFCEVDTVEKDGQSGSFEHCTDIPYQACTSPVDCQFSDLLTCNALLGDGAGGITESFCFFTNPGQADLGSSCTTGDACESDLCWNSEDETTGECSVFCEQSARDCGVGQVCANLGPVGACLSECTTSADCAGGNLCQIGVDETGLAVHSYCDVHVGDGDTGQECDEPTDCKSGLCLEVSTYQEGPEIDGEPAYCGLSIDEAFQLGCDVVYPGYPICDCPVDTPDCDDWQLVCVAITETQVCSELCDPSVGDASCHGDHDLVRCTDDVSVTWTGGSDTVAACSFGVEE